MTIYDLFGKVTPFERFSKAVGRLQNLLRVMEEEARREHFEQLKGHTLAVQRMIGSQTALNKECFIRLLEEERNKTEILPASEGNILLQKFEKEIETALIAIVQNINEIIPLCEKAIASQQNQTELLRYKEVLERKIYYVQQLRLELAERAELEEAEYDRL